MTSNQSQGGSKWNFKFEEGAEILSYISMHISRKNFKQQSKS